MSGETENNRIDDVFFFGEYEHSLDIQNRVAIPKDWRSKGAETRLIAFPGRDHDLLLFPFESFRDFLYKARKVSFANRNVQEALARIGARAQECRCDKQGRIKISERLLEPAGIKNQVMLIGALTHIKVCTPEYWKIQGKSDDVYLDEFQKISEGNDDIVQLFRETFGNPKPER